ncbi:hypothetical protein D9Q98_009182 [Chlorella vulgaris]|uniref:methionine--tRNA ligase n=1 Tax=Chlorella vulgaris TaxID=3077 RepID=A0A9D4TNY7_CHLVU|nr:hypothetical protein D9Q98_009182 [Chlorella vulgaris]
MATLVTRLDDPQALKAAAAAAAAGATLSVLALSDSSTWKKLLADPSCPEAARDIFLVLPNGTALGDPNAIARYLTGPALLLEGFDFANESWLEWEESHLRPAVYGGNAAALESAVQHLSAALSGSNQQFLGGSKLGLSDIAVFATLRPLADSSTLAPLQPYLQRVAALPALAEASQQLQLGSFDASNGDCSSSSFLADAAARQAALPKLPIPGQRNILITSALPYVNNVPHLGNIIGCVLSADVYARFCRSRGYNVVYVCGTDEYGTATETKALEEGLSCQQICDKYHAIHKSIYEWFDIGFDKFGRTPTRAQTEIGQSIFQTLQDRGCLVEQSMEQLFSEPLGKFLADRFVTGTCPKCKYDDARGDQCDSCGQLLNPTELINPKCALTGSTPVVRQTKHIFLDLPSLSPDLQAYIDRTSALGGWSSNCVQVTKAWMEQGLKVRCITRDLKWGTPVPRDGYENKVFYVWFDAPIGYISITANYCSDWQAWWKNPEDVELVQFMGKDNVPFHTVIFPATLLGTQEPWTMMKSISVTEYLNYEDGKFSKSRGVGVFGNDAKDTGIPVEVWRYYLLAVRPETSDSAFQWDDFAMKNNAELNDNLGNFINRTLKFCYARFEKTVPGEGAGGAGTEAVRSLGEKLGPLVEQYIAALEALRMKDALKAAMLVSKAGNLFFQETEIWVAYKQDREAASTYISACAGIVLLLAALLQPFMPSFTAKLLQQLGVQQPPLLTDDLVKAAASPATLLPAGHPIGAAEPTPLFRKITEDEVAELRARFAGNQADRTAAAATAAASGSSSAVSGAKSGKGGGKSAPAAATNAKSGPAGGGPAAAAAAASADGTATQAASGKEKQNKAKAAGSGGGKGGGGKGGAKEPERPADISRLNLRVGLITKAWRHPDAESLYVEEVDVGEAAPRTVVSGLVKFIPEAEMQQRRVVLVCNLKPANMRGIQSQAMVLAATAPDGSKVELVEPPAGAAIGERLSVEGFDCSQPDEQLNPKKKVWEAVQPDLATNELRVACYRGLPLLTSAGPATVSSVAGGSIK